jgi:2-methylisocitrate lyase-like PEP mutase family enzyme
MSERLEKARRFLALHRPGDPLLMPNPWDAGTAKLFASLGYRALATTSSGFAGTLGRLDGGVSRDEALAHADAIAAATELPVSADLEHGFGDDPAGVAETMRRAAATGIVGGSIEDYDADAAEPLLPFEEAVERVAKAVEVARRDETRLVLTARAENYLRGRRDLPDTLRRLQAYQAAGADVVYAPGLSDLAEIEQVVGSLDAPLNVLLLPGGPTVAELATVGVARISVGGSFHLLSLGAVEAAARTLLEHGTHDFWPTAQAGRRVRETAFD